MAEPEAPDVPLLISLYLVEALAVLAAIGAYRHDGSTGLWSLHTVDSQRFVAGDRKSTRLNSSHSELSRMPSSA